MSSTGLPRCLPKSLTHPTGIYFLPPAQRVTLAELEAADKQWRALREAAYMRSWAEDATLVGSARYIAAGGVAGEGLGRRTSSVMSGGQQQSNGGRRGTARRRRKALLRFLKSW
ncbi:hypothetical protein BDZ90DRAFT_260992 [Jaminaea rosea]|uniref:Uncharacterized protein n=1 Tax=Jaminaea rosea TaxID=1569628 RepID=A0A316UN48_9BASI|nr:hypothetical protein BDZ90DRAFT_260992 [Jaminaea rosea]PWN26732.1 hypothetical protein BDZ90DRAFT_260992 [Jaminaea rosea]